MSTIGYYVTCDDALCEECFFKNTDGSYDDAVSRWEQAGGFEEWEEPIAIDDSSESDTPTHCTECGTLIEHDLTDDGARYVLEAVEQCFREGKRSEVVEQWVNAYMAELDASDDMIDAFGLLPLRDQSELPHERFRTEDIERLGWLVLYWSRIPAQNQDAIDQFIEAIGNSSVPEACGIVGASITDELAPEDC